MSTTIDQKVVEMRFDNKQFERNVADTMSTLDKFKQKLNLSGSAKSFDEISASARRVDMSGLSTAIDMVNSRFSALGIMGVTALQNITNSAINTGKRMISALTIDPIRTGFSEYETKINSIQTIMSNTASKGTTMEDVTRVIGELNTYADKTIYNFAEMTRNIGTFTAAGIGLEDSASAIQGIANLAATSGSTSQQASTVMYQLSQAISSGVVKLMDWNSVVNAGMGGEKFQEALKATAREHGIAVDDIIEKQGSFRESLSEGWLSAEILQTTLQKFTTGGAKEYAKSMMDAGKWTQAEADALLKEAQAMEDAATKVKTFTQLWDTLKESAQSGWAQTWEILVGDFEEAKETLTKISDVIGEVINSSAEARNKLLQGWKDAGGRADLVDSLFNIIEAVKSIVTPIKEAFREIFPPTTVEQLKGFSEGLKEFTSKLKLSETASENLKRTFKGVFAVFDILKQALSAVFNLVKPLFGGLDDLGGGFLGVTASVGDWLVKLNETIKTTNIFGKAVEKISGFVKMAYEGVRKFIGVIKEKFVSPGIELFQSLIQRVSSRMTDIKDTAGTMKDGVSAAFSAIGKALASSNFFKLLTSVWNLVKTIGSGIVDVLGKLTGGLADKIGNANFSGIFDFINTLSFSAIAAFVAKFVKGFSDITETVGSFKESALGILEEVRGCFEAYQTSLKANTLLKIASAIAILVAALVVLTFVDSKKLSAAIGAITMLFTDLMASMAIVDKLDMGFDGLSKMTGAMIGLATSVLILAIALKTISDLNFKELAVGLAGVVGLTGTLVGAVKLLQSDGEKAIKGAFQMILFAAAIKVLADACLSLSTLKWEELGVGLAGIAGLMLIMAGYSKLMGGKGSLSMIATGASLIAIGAGVKVLASAMRDISGMKWDEIERGLAGIAGALIAIAVAMRIMPIASSISSAAAMVVMAGAMMVLIPTLQLAGKLSWGTIGKGLAVIGGSLAILAAGLNFMVGALPGAAALLVAVGALAVLVPIMRALGELTWEKIGKGLTAIAGAVAILAAGLTLMIGAIPGATALVIASAALAILTPILYALGTMSWDTIAQGLKAIALAFVVIGAAGLVLTPVIPSILALAASLALIGVTVLTTAIGLAIGAVALSGLAVGITALSAALTAGATSIVAGLTVIITGVISLIPAIIVKIGEGIVALCGVIIDSAPAIGAALGVLVTLLLQILIEHIPQIVDGLLLVITELLKSLVDYTPQIVGSIFEFVLAILKGIETYIPKIIQAAVDLIMAFFKGVVDALKGIDTDTLLKGIAGVGLMAGLMMALSMVAALVPTAMIGVLGMGLVIAELALVLAAIGALAQIPGLEWLISEGGDFLQKVGTAIGQFVGGIVGGIAEGVTASLPQMGTDLSNFMTNAQPFIEGARSINAETMAGVEAMAKVILTLTAADILDGLTSWFTGGSSIVTFGEELAKFGPYLRIYADSVKGVDGTVVEASANAALALAEMAAKLPNSGGVVGWFTGENSLSVFADELVKFGPSLKKYADSVKGLDGSVVTASASAASVLSEMAAKLPNSGGVVSWFAGDNTLSVFADELVKFGPKMKKYADSVKGIDNEAVISSATAAKALGELATNLPNKGGLVSWFSGDNDIGDFGDSLQDFGKAIKKYYNEISDINASALSSTTSSLAKIVNIIKGIGDISFDGVESFGDALKELAKAGIDSFIKAFVDADKRMTVTAVQVLNNCIVALVQQREKFITVGGLMVKGFAAGISQTTYEAVAKARAMARAAADAAEDELDIHSPSRVLYETGVNAGSGFVNALSDYVSVSYDAGSEVASSARDGINEAIKNIHDIVSGDMNVEPSIRPIVDLSNVESAASRISGLFNSDSSVGVLANVGSINSMMNQRGQNGGNKDVISAINGLRKDLADLPRNNYNINGITYDDGSNIHDAIEAIIHAALIERRV